MKRESRSWSETESPYFMIRKCGSHDPQVRAKGSSHEEKWARPPTTTPGAGKEGTGHRTQTCHLDPRS